MMMPSLKDDCKTSIGHCFNSTRFIILFISTAALSFVMANSLALNFTIICMIKEPVGFGEKEFIQELNITDPEPLYTLGEKSWLFSAIAIGNIFGTIPLTWSNNRFGIRKTFAFYGFISGISTILLPLFVDLSFILAFVARVFQGFGLAISLTSLGAIVSAWSSLQGAGSFISVLSMHIQFGAIIVMPVSGALCTSSLGWPAVYYILGGFTIIFFILFAIFYRDDPSTHSNVSEKEVELIKEGRMLSAGEHPPIPYKRIVCDLPVIGIIVSCFGGSCGLQLMFQYGPTYLNKILGFDIAKVGFAAALPYVLSVIVKMFAGPFSDLITCISDRGRIILFNTASQLPMCICFILMAALPPELGWLIQIAYSLVNSFSGLNSVGVAKCVQLISQHHAHFIMTLMSLINSIVILILPPLVSIIAPDNSVEQWATIFYIISFCIFVTMMFFNFTCQVTPRDWALEDQRPIIIAEAPPKKSSQGVVVEFEAPIKVISGQSHNLQILPLDSPSEPIHGKSQVSLIVTKS